MNLLFFCDEKFCQIFAVALISVLENNKTAEKISVYLIENNISDASKNSISDVVHSYQREIIFVPMPDLRSLVGVDMFLPERLSIVDYVRLFVGYLLPKDVDKVIQIDCDVIVRGSLDALWEFDMDGALAAMVNEGHCRVMRSLLDIPEYGCYYNCGIMIMDLNGWRTSEIDKAAIEYIRKRNGYIPLNVQGVFNAILDGRTKTLPAEYNVHPLMLAFSHSEYRRLRSAEIYYSQEEYDNAVKNPIIVHFMTCFYWDVRPWMEKCMHPMRSEYLKYRSLSPWKDKPLWKYKQRLSRRVYEKLCHILPKNTVIKMSSWIYSVALPNQHRRRQREAIGRAVAV